MQENKKNRDASIFMNREEKQKLKAEKKAAESEGEAGTERKSGLFIRRQKETKPGRSSGGKLDNTAHLFPVIAGEGMTNVYRVAVILKKKFSRNCCSRHWTWCCRNFLYLTADCVRVCSGIILKRMEKKSPTVHEEHTYPCRYIDEHRNRSYLFRVTYYAAVSIWKFFIH